MLSGYTLSPRFAAFEKAKAYILDPNRPYLLPNDPVVEVVRRHFVTMFDGPRDDLYGREKRTYRKPITRWDTSGVSTVSIADWEATQGSALGFSLADIRGKAFENVMEAYLLYITALGKLAGPKTSASVQPTGDAPPLPAGMGWLPVEADIMAARDMMKAAAGSRGFGIELALHPDFYADYMETVESWADVTLEDRGAWDYFGGPYMLTTWREVVNGKPVKKVAKTNVTAAAFGEDFVIFDSKTKTMMRDDAIAYMRDKKLERSARQQRLPKEAGLKKKKGGGVASDAARSVYRAGLQSVFGVTPQAPTEGAKPPPAIAARSEADLELEEALGLKSTATTRRETVPVPAAPKGDASAGDISDDFDALFQGLQNNPSGRYRRVR